MLNPEFKKQTDISTIRNMIKNIDSIVAKEHINNESDLIDSDFNFARTLELEGYWLLPDGQFDFGDTQSSGIQLIDVSPLMDIVTFKSKLLYNLNQIVSELEKR